MHIRAVLLVLFFLILPIPASADFVSLLPNSSSCPKGTAGNPSGPTKSFTLSSSATEIRSYLYRRVVCPSACFDEAVTLNVSVTGISATVSAQNKCKVTKEDPQAQDAKKDNRGCSKGQTNPRVAVKITGLTEQVIPPKSRCDTSNLTGVINSLAEQKFSEALTRLNTLGSPLVGVAVIAPVNLETGAGQKVLAEQLATAFQITPDKAEAIVAKDPQAALRAIYAVAQGDAAAVKAEAESLGLNPDLTDRVALNAKLIQDGGLTEPDESGVPGTGDNTFREVARVGVADVLAPLCGQLGGCGENACLSRPNSLTCLGNNPGALTFTSWQTKYGGRPCGLNNNTTCFDTVEGGIAAQANLLTTSSRYFGSGNNTILGAFCNGYSTSNCSQYAVFISAQTGIPLNQTIDPKNTEQIAAIMMASSRFENGRGVIYTPEQLQKGLQVAFGNEKLPEGTPGYIARTIFGTNGGTQFGSPLNFGASASPTNVGYGSAFGNAAPAPVAQQIAYNTQPTPTPASQTVSQNVTPSQTQTTSSGTSGVATQLQNALEDPALAGIAGQFPANVMVQPSEVVRGNPVTVSWTSIGMSTVTPCVLRAGSTVIAEKNKGSSVVPTTQATRPGSLIFTLSCTTASGTTYQRTAAVMVR